MSKKSDVFDGGGVITTNRLAGSARAANTTPPPPPVITVRTRRSNPNRGFMCAPATASPVNYPATTPLLNAPGSSPVRLWALGDPLARPFYRSPGGRFLPPPPPKEESASKKSPSRNSRGRTNCPLASSERAGPLCSGGVGRPIPNCSPGRFPPRPTRNHRTCTVS